MKWLCLHGGYHKVLDALLPNICTVDMVIGARGTIIATVVHLGTIAAMASDVGVVVLFTSRYPCYSEHCLMCTDFQSPIFFFYTNILCYKATIWHA